MSICPYCNCEQEIRYYSAGAPILNCGHGLFPEGSDDKLLQDICIEEQQIKERIMRERNISEGEASSLRLKELISQMGRAEMIAMLRSLARLGLWSPVLSDLVEMYALPEGEIFGDAARLT